MGIDDSDDEPTTARRDPNSTSLPLYVDDESDAIPNTPPPINSKIFFSLFPDDSDDEPHSLPLYVDNESAPTTAGSSTSHSASINKTCSDDEYVFSDIELTDDLIAVLDKTCSDDEYVFSDIELTEDLITVLDKTYSEFFFYHRFLYFCFSYSHSPSSGTFNLFVFLMPYSASELIQLCLFSVVGEPDRNFGQVNTSMV
jgi:hypothetical protein